MRLLHARYMQPVVRTSHCGRGRMLCFATLHVSLFLPAPSYSHSPSSMPRQLLWYLIWLPQGFEMGAGSCDNDSLKVSCSIASSLTCDHLIKIRLPFLFYGIGHDFGYSHVVVF